MVREDTHKKNVFFSGRTTKRVGGGGNPPDHLSKKTLFSINGENSPGNCIKKILYYEVRHFSPKLYTHFCLCIFLLVRKQYLPKKNPTFLAQKF